MTASCLAYFSKSLRKSANPAPGRKPVSICSFPSYPSSLPTREAVCVHRLSGLETIVSTCTLRAASAGEHVMNPKKDEKRALDKEGIEQCGYIGRALAALNVQVDTIVSSPLKRCTQTASLVGNELGYEGKLQIDAGLRPGAGFADFRKLLEKYAKQEAVMVVGHNPNLSQFL